LSGAIAIGTFELEPSRQRPVPALPRCARERGHDEGIQLTTFVRPRADGALDVWYLPAFQPDGWAVYGIELRYVLGPAARRVTDSAHVIGTLRGSLLDSTVTIEIDNQRNAMPSVGEAFFAMLYASRFDTVLILNRDFISEFAAVDGARAWVHDRRERPPPPE
jgi:hypothetical protein